MSSTENQIDNVERSIVDTKIEISDIKRGLSVYYEILNERNKRENEITKIDTTLKVFNAQLTQLKEKENQLLELDKKLIPLYEEQKKDEYHWLNGETIKHWELMKNMKHSSHPMLMNLNGLARAEKVTYNTARSLVERKLIAGVHIDTELITDFNQFNEVVRKQVKSYWIHREYIRIKSKYTPKKEKK